MKKILLITLLFLQTSWLSAATISAKITFSGRPAFSAVAYVENGSEAQNQVIDQKAKKFTQKMYISASTGQVNFTNSDDIDHNIYANSPKDNIKFDIGLLTSGQDYQLDTSNWKEGSVVRIGCKIHPKMKSYIAMVPASNSKIIEFKKGVKEYVVEFTDLEEAQPFHLRIPGYLPIKVDLNLGETKTLELMKKKKIKGQLEVIYK